MIHGDLSRTTMYCLLAILVLVNVKRQRTMRFYNWVTWAVRPWDVHLNAGAVSAKSMGTSSKPASVWCTCTSTSARNNEKIIQTGTTEDRLWRFGSLRKCVHLSRLTNIQDQIETLINTANNSFRMTSPSLSRNHVAPHILVVHKRFLQAAWKTSCGETLQIDGCIQAPCMQKDFSHSSCPFSLPGHVWHILHNGVAITFLELGCNVQKQAIDDRAWAWIVTLPRWKHPEQLPMGISLTFDDPWIHSALDIRSSARFYYLYALLNMS